MTFSHLSQMPFKSKISCGGIWQNVWRTGAGGNPMNTLEQNEIWRWTKNVWKMIVLKKMFIKYKKLPETFWMNFSVFFSIRDTGWPRLKTAAHNPKWLMETKSQTSDVQSLGAKWTQIYYQLCKSVCLLNFRRVKGGLDVGEGL